MKLTNTLTREQEAAGLMVYDDEDMVYLTDGEKVFARWSAASVTRSIIQTEAQNVLTCKV